ncbi:cation diffusion facilitator family transporter [uncultured Adlercreutzia sp.]|uniref:cation diffusion facilitator family transporter n=1 Tax=uncultured Adlercreutzia sp. TaxID=875803 RepID=UPI0026F3AAD7|nr:cation diffusion facilitator family transporter [uncultured Adlercreutzia sp.]
MKNEREREIVKASFVGIAGNMLLVAFKLVVGFLSNSIAIILDAVNNATDALSSIVTIVGTKIAGMRPNRRHPFGYGRIEYLTSVIIAIIILVAGALSLRESIDKIIHPAQTNYTALTITVIVVAIIAKIFIGVYFKRAGDKTNSQALIASGIDSNYDAVLSAGTLVVAIVQLAWNVNIDGIVGLLISLVVIKAGLEVLADALGPIIGEREDDELGRKIEDYVNSFPGVRGTYDLLLDNFGPNETIGSLHIEVPDDLSAREIHELTRQITLGLFDKFNIVATVGIYAENTTGQFAPMRAELDRIVKDEPKVLQTHGFYVDEANKTVYFDLVIDFKADDDAIRDAVVAAMREKYPAYDYNVIVDTDYEG